MGGEWKVGATTNGKYPDSKGHHNYESTVGFYSTMFLLQILPLQ